MEISSDSDEELEIAELNQLTAVLEAEAHTSIEKKVGRKLRIAGDLDATTSKPKEDALKTLGSHLITPENLTNSLVCQTTISDKEKPLIENLQCDDREIVLHAIVPDCSSKSLSSNISEFNLPMSDGHLVQHSTSNLNRKDMNLTTKQWAMAHVEPMSEDDYESDIIRLSPLKDISKSDNNNTLELLMSDQQSITNEDSQMCDLKQLTDVLDDEELSNSDEEMQMQELNQLNAVLQADKASSKSCVSQYSITSDIPSDKLEKHHKIQTALALNKLTDEKLQKLEGVLSNRLRECQHKIKEISGTLSAADRQEKTFRYVYCGKPYFRGQDNFAAPDNEDTLLMNKLNMYDFSLVLSVPGWTVKDKSIFLSVIHKMSIELKKTQLQSQISQLQRETKGGKSLNKCIAAVRKELNSVHEKSLEALALPISEEYDWDAIANKTNYRHGPQEYRALWKLFLHPSINKNSWTKGEHLRLQKIAHDHELQNWERIAQELNTGRTGYQCFVYFRTNMSNTFTGQKWTKEEEEYLKRLIDYYRENNYIPWGKVAASMENRTKIQIYNKYARLMENRKGRFVPEEDAVLLTCIKDFGSNFRRITKYLPGRSATQLRRRYHVLLNETRTSIVWTVEEDRKLIQFMANQDTSTNYASLTKHFPGKDRTNIRARYTTLVRWMRKHPHLDVAKAPRRGARRLGHGQVSQDLNEAVETLKNRIQTDVQTKKGNRITKDSPEEAIEHSIIATLINENIKEEEVKKNELSEWETAGIEKQFGLSTTSKNIDNLYRLLILMKAKLDKSKFISSSYHDEYEGLVTLEKKDAYVLVKSYSRKDSVQVIKQNKPSIWGGNLLSSSEYVFPPNYATITGCRKLMGYASMKPNNVEPLFNIGIVLRKNEHTRNQYKLLMQRFHSLFLWPMLLSNECPSSQHNEFERIDVVRPRTVVQSGDPGVTIPIPRKKVNINVNENIDLQESDNVEDVALKDDFVSNNEFVDIEN